MSSCYEKTELFHSPEAGDAQSIQLVLGDQYVSMNKLDANNDPSDLVTTIDIKVLGPAPTSDLTVDFDITLEGYINGEDTVIAATTDMFTLSATSFTVPAGSSMGSIDLTLVNLGMPLQQGVSFKIKLKDGSVPVYTVNNEAIYTLYKKDFCPWEVADFVGDYDVTYTSAWGVDISETWTIADTEDGNMTIDGIWYGGPPAIWGETMVGSSVPTIIDIEASDPASPVITIPLNEDGTAQFLNSSTDGSAVYDYYVFDLNTKEGNEDYNWELDYCGQTLTIFVGIGPDDYSAYYDYIIGYIIDYGAKKIYVNYEENSNPLFNIKNVVRQAR